MTTTEDERKILRQAKDMRELESAPGWDTFQAILVANIAARRTLIETPLGLLGEGSGANDFYMRVMGQEGLKGARIGIQLALDIPRVTMDQAKEISDREEASEEDDNG